MTDTVRSLSALMVLMPVSTAGGVSAQDERDVANSAIGVVPAGAKTASYTLTDDDEFMTADATSGAVVFTLPAASTTRAGKVFIIQKIDAGGNAVSFARAGSDTINTATSKSTTTQFYALMVIRASSSTWSCFTLTGS